MNGPWIELGRDELVCRQVCVTTTAQKKYIDPASFFLDVYPVWRQVLFVIHDYHAHSPQLRADSSSSATAPRHLNVQGRAGLDKAGKDWSGQASAGAPARSAAEQEDADMALALSLQSKFEEEERRRQQQAQLQSQQQARGGVTGAPVRGGASSAASRQIASSGTAGDQMTNYRLSQQVLLTSPSSDCAGTCCMCSALKPPELCRNGTCSKAVDRRVNLVGWCKVLHKRGQCKARRQGLHKGGQRRVSMADLPKRTRVAFCSRT